MKKLQSIFAIIIFIFFALHSNYSTAQNSKQQKENKKQQAVSQLVNSQHYTFIPNTVLPSRGASKMLTSEYELKIKKDTLSSYLPYFGRAYTASISVTENPLDFKTTDFKYTIAEDKKGGWNINMVPKNGGDARQLMLSISQNGYASLQIIFNNRDPISFNGYIQ
ncbi:MAG TPA: DUF4251 domain-containing protein [Puia sp.]|jgi:hypothetical protein|nr:DUF4251 domain-containing protein [Puia sp.]